MSHTLERKLYWNADHTILTVEVYCPTCRMHGKKPFHVRDIEEGENAPVKVMTRAMKSGGCYVNGYRDIPKDQAWTRDETFEQWQQTAKIVVNAPPEQLHGFASRKWIWLREDGSMEPAVVIDAPEAGPSLLPPGKPARLILIDDAPGLRESLEEAGLWPTTH
jgi:hypothetical protein